MTSAMLFTMMLCFALTILVAVSIGLAALVGIQILNGNMLVAVKEMFSSINKFPLAAIPLFHPRGQPDGNRRHQPPSRRVRE